MQDVDSRCTLKLLIFFSRHAITPLMLSFAKKESVGWDVAQLQRACLLCMRFWCMMGWCLALQNESPCLCDNMHFVVPGSWLKCSRTISSSCISCKCVSLPFTSSCHGWWLLLCHTCSYSAQAVTHHSEKFAFQVLTETTKKLHLINSVNFRRDNISHGCYWNSPLSEKVIH